MIIIPAIDLMNNHCVRLLQGEFDKQTIYSSSPVKTAQGFQKQGFTHLHMVDLDGARQRKPVHLHVLKEVCENSGLFVDFSGGIRNPEEAAMVFDAGASALTLGSMAVKNPQWAEEILRQWGAEKIILGADVKNGNIATAGWQEESEYELTDFLDTWFSKGIQTVMITDVSKDGMMQGPALELYESVLERFPEIRLIASGGIANMNDIHALSNLGCYGAITGKALYENALDFNELKTYLPQ